jgi:anti-anti-sigma factor
VEEFGLTVSVEGDATVIAVRGELDFATAPAVRSAVEDVLAAVQQTVVIDIRGIEFADSHGLGALVACAKLARSVGVELRLRNPSLKVLRVMEVLNLGRVVPIDTNLSLN